MCGIYGIWHLDGKQVQTNDLVWATNRLRRRGPDDEGYLLVDVQQGGGQPLGGDDTQPALQLSHWQGYEAGLDQTNFSLGLGFRRLSIIDLSPAGHQPMPSQDGNLWLVFNGEIYNYLELRVELVQRGFSFSTATDSEVILAAYQAWGVDCLERFNGMWALAIWDQRAQHLFLARDRFGVKPLYYVQTPEKFVFASEIKALVGQKGLAFQPEAGAIYRYLIAGQLPLAQSGATFFSGVHSLPPGQALLVSREEVKRFTYWTLDVQAEPANQSVEALLKPYRALFQDAVRLRLRSDVPVGTCLSGGLDSSAIVATIKRLMTEQGFSSEQIGQQQRTFSAVYDQTGPFNERVYIERMLTASGAQGLFAQPSAEQLQQEAEQLVWQQDEPFQSTSLFAQWRVMELAHKAGVKVLLDGQGADEILGGYRPFRIYLLDLLRTGQYAAAWRAAQAISAHSDLDGWRFLRSALAEYGLGWTGYPAWQAAQARQANLEYLTADFQANDQLENVERGELRWSRSLDDQLRDQFQETSLPNLLRYEDRNSMAFGVEARLPFLDYRFVRYNFGEAAGWRIADGWSKYILRRAMQADVPEEIVWRKDKVGFATPEGDWLRQWLQSEPSWLNEPWLAQDYLEVEQVKSRIKTWLEQSGELPTLWRWMNLELWLRVWQVA